MKHVLLSAFLVLCAVAAVRAAVPFEGSVAYDINANGRSIDMTVLIKDQKSKVEVGMPGRTFDLLMDWEAQKAYMLMDEQQMAMTVPLALPEKMQDKVSEKMAAPERTGKTQTILGYTCEQWIARNGENTIEIWSAKGLGNFTGFMGQAPLGINTGFPDISAIAAMEEFFPMSITVKNRSGRQVFSMKATSVEKKELAANLFTIPSSYRIVDAPQGMGAMEK